MAVVRRLDDGCMLSLVCGSALARLRQRKMRPNVKRVLNSTRWTHRLQYRGRLILGDDQSPLRAFLVFSISMVLETASILKSRPQSSHCWRKGSRIEVESAVLVCSPRPVQVAGT